MMQLSVLKLFLKGPTTRIRNNGSLTERIRPERGAQQGCCPPFFWVTFHLVRQNLFSERAGSQAASILVLT